MVSTRSVAYLSSFFAGGELAEVTEAVREAAHLTSVRHDSGGSSLEERVVTAPDVDDVLSLRAAHGHHFHPVAENLCFFKPLRLLRAAALLRAHGDRSAGLYHAIARIKHITVSHSLIFQSLAAFAHPAPNPPSPSRVLRLPPSTAVARTRRPRRAMPSRTTPSTKRNEMFYIHRSIHPSVVTVAVAVAHATARSPTPARSRHAAG